MNFPQQNVYVHIDTSYESNILKDLTTNNPIKFIQRDILIHEPLQK